MRTATIVYNDYTTYGKIISSTDVDYFKVQFSTSGNANFWLGDIPAGEDYDLFLYNDKGGILKNSKGTSSQEQIYNYPVKAGTWYYLKVIGYGGSYSTSKFYRLRAKCYPVTEVPDSYETNNTFSTATSIGKNTTLASATIHNTSDVDYYKFTLPEASNFDISLSNIPSECDYELELYKNASTLCASSKKSGNSAERISGYLPAGTYYIKVYSYKNKSSKPYTLSLSSKAAYTLDQFEPNDSFSTAVSIQAPKTIQGTIHTVNDKDYYRLTIPDMSGITITLENIPASCDYELKLFNSSKKMISSSTNGAGKDEVIYTTLTSGTYYIWVHSYAGASSTNYKLTVSALDPLVYDNFSRTLQNPAIPPTISAALEAVEREFNVGLPEVYHTIINSLSKIALIL